ncbi:MAG: hypothetical protein OXM56_08605 [Gammaproteobacteria bacterium]|nr:hypothetical protein [Gammaproteobacteria bacterium]
MAALKDAIALLEQGKWEDAHTIVQKDGSPLGSWAHGIVHVLEGDLRNAGYWYRRAGRELPDEVDVEAEVAALKAEAG